MHHLPWENGLYDEPLHLFSEQERTRSICRVVLVRAVKGFICKAIERCSLPGSLLSISRYLAGVILPWCPSRYH